MSKSDPIELSPAREIAAELQALVEAVLPRLGALSESDVTRDRGPSKWVLKEILGHLVDSAANNHQRFVRAQLSDPLVAPGYEQDAWVRIHGYRQRPWSELLDTWITWNRHIRIVIAQVPSERLTTKCMIADDEPVTLEWLMRDYVRHMRHHLRQILGDSDE